MHAERKTIGISEPLKLKEKPAKTPVDHPLASEYLSTRELAAILRTDEPVIRQSRLTGKLFGRPAPEFLRVGERKLLYSAKTIREWIEDGLKGTVAGTEK